MGLFGNVFGIVGDIVDVCDSVVSVPLAVIKPITGVIADGAQAIKEEIENLVED